MRILLMLTGVVICAGALLFWIWLNGMAAAYTLAHAPPPIQWFSEEALYYFWGPFAVGASIAFIGWKRY